MPPSQAAHAKAGSTPLPILLDTTVLNNFIKVGQHSLLRQLFPTSTYITAEVYDELKAGGLAEHIQQGVNEAWIRLVRLESEREVTLYREYSRTLGSGEAASLAVAICRAWALATDDRAARAAARAAGVPLTGSVGILIIGVQAGSISRQEGNRLLQEMRRHGYHFPFGSLEGLL